MKLKDLIIQTFKNTEIYKIYNKEEIIKLVKEYALTLNQDTPPESSIIPSDYCYNITNDGIDDFKSCLHIFEVINIDEKKYKYKYLGEGYPYNGITYKKSGNRKQTVGEWNEGVFLLANKIQKNTSLWIAAAILTYKVFSTYTNPKIDDIFFSQSEIIKTAKEIYNNINGTQNISIPNALANMHANAYHKSNNYNYLVPGNGSLRQKRRISYTGEFDNEIESPDFDKNYIIQVDSISLSVNELQDFISHKYKEYCVSQYVSNNSIDIERIVNFLTVYGDKKYSKSQANEEHENMRIDGPLCRKEFEKFGINTCKVYPMYLLDNVSSWVNQGQIINHFFWIELKKEEYIDSNSSMSITLSIRDGNIDFAVLVELRSVKASSDEFKIHNRIAELDLSADLKYRIETLEGEYKPVDWDKSTMLTNIKNDEIKKVRIEYPINITLKNENIMKIQEEIYKGVEMLEPYYNYIFEEKNNKGDKGMNNNISLNTILCGPPGTGKTYNTINYAVSIIDERPVEDVQKSDYSETFRRFNELKDSNQIEFVTFHQSYGYEDFIEGLRPTINDENDEGVNDLSYEIRAGVFKRFCDRSETVLLDQGATEYELSERNTIWKVSLGGTYENEIREDCLKNNYVRIGWDDYGAEISDRTKYKDGGKVVLNAFINKMKIGDIVVSCYNSTTTDAIGIITSDSYWNDELDEFKRLRDVKWIVKDIRADILSMNNNTPMTLATVYKLNNLSINNIKEIIKTNSNTELKNEEKNYVFIIDEINRGNISKIFGELITLIESDKRIGSEHESRSILPYSGNSFGIPKNVYLLGTMNTADRSIAMLDTALRRRFDFVEIMPDISVLYDIKISVSDYTIDIALLLDTINKRIEYLYDREHTIGHSYFIPLKQSPSFNILSDIFKNKIIPLMQEYFYEDYEKIQLVLGDNYKDKQYRFIDDIDSDINNLFNDDPDIDIPEKKYIINGDALLHPESYIGIYEK